jgi:hypothetical protein
MSGTMQHVFFDRKFPAVARPRSRAVRCRMAEGDPEGGPKGPRIQLQMDEQTSLGRYSNLVLINHTENEFVLDFAFFAPGAPRAKVRARIISSPRHTKRLLRALQVNVEKYEERFGEIDTTGSSDDEPIVH